MIDKVIAGEDLTAEEAEEAMKRMIAGSMSQMRAAALLVALRMKGESEGEVTAFARQMREKAVKINPKRDGLVDTCGTGGDCKGTLNISTISAFIAAGAGVVIAKHGNRSVSSSCGSFDLLEELGLKALEPKDVERSIDEVGIGFMFAPLFHPAMKNIMPVRKELGVRTVFNMLGPLTNPAGAEAQVIGVYDPALCPLFAKVLRNLGSKQALVVHSEGMDEFGLGKSIVCELKDGEISSYEVDGVELGLANGSVPRVSSKEESARLALRILGGEKCEGREICLLNAAAAIYVGGKAGSLKEGLEMAEKAVGEGKAMEKLEQVRSFKGG